MIEKKLKAINLPQFADGAFDIATVAGRDELADQISSDIDAYCVAMFDDGPRSHLGASVIGHNCERYIWFHFRWIKIEKFKARMLRLFERGHREEDRVVEWLRGIGFDVQQTEIDGKQVRIAAVNGHFGGSRDASATLPTRYGSFPPFLLEFKTANDNQFGRLIGSGVVKTKPRHYTQMCVYGYKMNLEYALYICVNKNDDELDVEVLSLDWELAKAELAKAEIIIMSQTPPRRLNDNPSYWECKYCPMLAVCHLGDPADKNCRSCHFAQPTNDAQWYCHQWKAIIPKDAIPLGCEAWVQLAK